MIVTVLLWALEVWCAYIIAKDNRQLTLPKSLPEDEALVENLQLDGRDHKMKVNLTTWPQKLYSAIYHNPRARLQEYFSMPVWPASVSISILQLSILAYSGTLVTYLWEVGYSVLAVTIARGTGTAMALLGTLIVPVIANYLRKRYSRSQSTSDIEIEAKVVRRIGLWGVSSQFFFLVCPLPSRGIENSFKIETTSFDSERLTCTLDPSRHCAMEPLPQIINISA